jgi:hypothetical protein
VSRAQLPLVIGVVLAVVIPAAVLELCAGEARLAAEMSAAPFAWRRVLIAHLLAAIPLGLTCAAWLHTRPAVASLPRWPWLVMGLTAALAVAATSANYGEALARSGAGPTPLLLLRALVALLLVLPWCLASLDPLPKENTPVPAAPRGIVFLAGLGLAVVPCGMYAAAVTAARTDEAAQLVNQRRLARAHWVATGLCELGSERRVGMRSPAQLRSWLAATLQGLRRQAEQPIATSPSEADRVSRAVLFVQLERLDEAAAILEPLVPADDIPPP